MFFVCPGCRKMVFYLDEDCPFCGRKFNEFDGDAENKSSQLGLFDEISDEQLRLFEC